MPSLNLSWDQNTFLIKIKIPKCVYSNDNEKSALFWVVLRKCMKSKFC